MRQRGEEGGDRRALDASVGMFMFGRKAARPIDVDQLIAYYDEQPVLFATTRRLARDATLRSALTGSSMVSNSTVAPASQNKI